jgi:hypothetical protein
MLNIINLKRMCGLAYKIMFLCMCTSFSMSYPVALLDATVTRICDGCAELVLADYVYSCTFSLNIKGHSFKDFSGGNFGDGVYVNQVMNSPNGDWSFIGTLAEDTSDKEHTSFFTSTLGQIHLNFANANDSANGVCVHSVVTWFSLPIIS